MNIPLQTVIISGLPLSGKTRLLDWLVALPRYTDHVLVSVDKVRHDLFGDRKISWDEHMKKNQVAWERVKHAHDTRRKSVIQEIPMLDEENYWKPVLAMVADTNKCLHPFSTTLRVVQLFSTAFCAEKRAKRRTEEVSQFGNKSGTDVFDLATRKVGIMKMEFPTIFNPLYVDTSDESEEAIASYRNDILAYLEGDDQNVVGEEYTRRLSKAKEAHAGLKRLVATL